MAATRKMVVVMVAVIAAAALVTGAPTLRGTFVGGDDYRLVLNHVLVNHPSVTHAIQLFTIVHRDLYQPLPLLSFQLEFAVADFLGFFDKGLAGGEWLFHFTNTMLHAINAVLVWLVIRMLHRPVDAQRADVVAAIAAVLFAIHPLQVEVVAWVNGRMMLLSTLFALAAVASIIRWLGDGRHRWAVLTIVFVACSATSKIRVGLPLLLLIPLLAYRRRITARYVAVWAASVLVTAVFAIVNYRATAEAGLFSGAAENLHGPKVVRAMLALAWYFEHLIWPAGLASWYPTPAVVRWSDPLTLQALAVMAVVAATVGWAVMRSRPMAWGFAWFFVTIAAVVQLVPSRNVLAADRYMYLPIIGLLWCVGVILTRVYEAAARNRSSGPVRVAAGIAATAVIAAMIGQSWHIASYYETPIKKSRRITQICPDTPHVWERLAWALYHAERYEEAVQAAEREFGNDNVLAHSEAYQVIGMSEFRRGHYDQALTILHQAIEADPDNTQARYYLAQVLEDVGRPIEALRELEAAVADAPLANPRILRLAELYRRLGRNPDAYKMYEQAVANNPYEVKGTLGLAELEIEAGTVESFRAAARRLDGLLEWMPENADAWVDLGVAYSGLGQTGEAMDAYQRALAEDPQHATAALNLAVLLQERGGADRAAALYALAARSGLDTVAQTAAVHDYFVDRGAPRKALDLWDNFLARHPDSVEARAFRAWSLALIGEVPTAEAEAQRLSSGPSPPPLAQGTLAYTALIKGRYADAAETTDALCRLGPLAADARSRLLRRLERFAADQPETAWTYCLAAELLLADERVEAARIGTALCADRCQENDCRDRVASLRTRLADESAAGSSPEPTAP